MSISLADKMMKMDTSLNYAVNESGVREFTYIGVDYQCWWNSHKLELSKREDEVILDVNISVEVTIQDVGTFNKLRVELDKKFHYITIMKIDKDRTFYHNRNSKKYKIFTQAMCIKHIGIEYGLNQDRVISDVHYDVKRILKKVHDKTLPSSIKFLKED